MIARLVGLVLMMMPMAAPGSWANDCPAWYSTACWARNLQDLIDGMKDVSDGMKQYGDKALASVYQASQGLGEVADKAGGALKQAYGKLAENHDKICADDDLFFIESVGVIAAGIFAVEVAMTGGMSGGAGAVALKSLLISQSPSLMSKLHQRLCGTPFTKAEPGLVTQVETVIDKTLSGK